MGVHRQVTMSSAKPWKWSCWCSLLCEHRQGSFGHTQDWLVHWLWLTLFYPRQRHITTNYQVLAAPWWPSASPKSVVYLLSLLARAAIFVEAGGALVITGHFVHELHVCVGLLPSSLGCWLCHAFATVAEADSVGAQTLRQR